MKMSNEEMKRWHFPVIMARINAAKQMVFNLIRSGGTKTVPYYAYQIKREMLQIRKHIVFMDEFIRELENLEEKNNIKKP